MFPENITEYLENEDVAFESNSNTFNGTSFLYDFEKGDFVYKNGAPIIVEGIAALKVWIEKCIRTEKFHWGVYEGVNFGPQLNDLIGTNLPQGFVQSELKREITEALLVNPYIDNIENFTFEKINDKGIVSFDVVTNDEMFGMEVSINER